MRRLAISFRHLAVLVALGGCGGGNGAAAPPTPPAAVPALARRPAAAGELVVRGQAAPVSSRVFAFHGRYRVRYVQYAPEDPRPDFGAQTPFVVELARGRADPREVFRAAAASGERTLRIEGRLRVDVSFGDFPFAVRFTPA